MTDHDGSDVFLVLLDANGKCFVVGLRHGGFGTGKTWSARLALAVPDGVVVPAIVACTSTVSLWVEASLLVERDSANTVRVAVDASTSSAVMSAGHEGEDGGASWSGAARSGGVRL